MAQSVWGVNDALAVKLWAQKVARESIAATYIGKFIGNDSNSLIMQRTELNKSAGDKITYGLRAKLTGDGVQGDNVLEGGEEAMVTYSDSLFVNQLRHAVRSGGKMSEQRVPFSVRDEARAGLVDWWADRYDTSFFYHICGSSGVTDTRYTGNNTTTAPTSTRVVYATASGTAHTTEASVSSTDVMSLTVIDRAIENAKTVAPLMRPVRVGNQDLWVVFLHPYQVYDLQVSTTTGQWLDIQKSAMMGGEISKNPLFTGALGMYKNCVLHESNRIATGATTSQRRAVLCGAQAATIAFAGATKSVDAMNWREELFDYSNQLGVGVSSTFGLKKNVYNSIDFATVVMTSYAVAH